MHDFTLPANIKQIGSIGSGVRIYMEDYVCTFLHQYATAGGYNERLAYLVGRHMLIDGQSYLFISGAIYGMYTEQREGFCRFTSQSADYAEAMLEEHFPGQEIVGWMQSQPSYGTFLNQHYGGYHLRQFQKPYQVLFVMDPLERVNSFYTANAAAVTPSERMAEVSGYFIYYEKNVNMHEYMLSNKSPDYTSTPTFVDFTPVVDEEKEHTSPLAGDFGTLEGSAADFNWYKEEDEEDNGSRFTANSDEVLRRRQQYNRAKPEKKGGMNMLASLCAVLFIVTFVMGVGLVRNQDRIDRMEGEIRQLVTAHRNLFAQITSPELTPVFAETPNGVADSTPVIENENEAESGTETGAHFYSHVYEAPASTSTYVETQPPVVEATPPPPEPDPDPPVVFIERPHPGSHAAAHDTYVIQPGDSLLAIALYFFQDANMVAAILELNDMDDPDMIVAGSTILLPSRP